MSFFQPEKYFSRVCHIDVQFDLLRKGKTCVLLDIDNTIRARGTHEIPFDILRWIASAREAGVKFCLLSNNWHKNAPELADKLDMEIVARAMKPLPFAFLAAAKKMGVSRDACCAVGDQLVTDVVGAHLAGMCAYLVQPLVEEDLPHTLVLRNLERVFLADISPEPAPTSASVPAQSQAFEQK